MTKMIGVPPALTDWKVVRSVNRENIEQYKDHVFVGKSFWDDTEDCWILSWGDTLYGVKHGIIETGFFWDGAHIDTHGLYKFSSFTLCDAQEQIDSFVAPKSASDIVRESGLPQSKYRQSSPITTWDGVVLAVQNPTDRSIKTGASPEDYYRFLEGACKHYGKHLFLKMHPWNNNEIYVRIATIAKEHGCQFGKTDHTIIEKCKFVLVWNSSFAVDCFVRRVPVAQYAPGYFFQTKAVTYTNGEFPDDVNDTTDAGSALADFIIWRYCFNHAMPVGRWIEMLELFANSNKLFPMTDDFCYATNTAWSSQ